ncbi:MAG: hypothetical protein AAB559_01330 [Patescibacteria group bacterium]
MNTNLKNEINFLIKPVAIMFVVVVLTLTVAVLGFNKIVLIKSENEQAKEKEMVFQTKALILEQVETVLPGDITFLDVVLPSRGSVLYGLSQIKNQAIIYNLFLSNVKSGTLIPENAGVSKVTISFEAEGEEQNVYKFLDSFSTLLPLMNIDKVSLSKSASLVRANVSINVFSAELPKKIPALTGVVNELTTKEVALLKELATYTLPQFIEPQVSETTGQKEDPFN